MTLRVPDVGKRTALDRNPRGSTMTARRLRGRRHPRSPGGVIGGDHDEHAPTLDGPEVVTLAASLTGRVLQPGDAGYDDARRVHNGLIDRRPALIVRCRTAADVAAAVRFARGGAHEISVRGGGHNVGGLAVADDAVMVDLAEMKGIQVDPKARTARAEGG